MKTYFSICFILINFSVFCQDIGNTELLFSIDSVSVREWNNLTEFEKGQDYIKALDIKFVIDDTSKHEYSQLLKDLWKLTFPYGKEMYLVMSERSRRARENNMSILYRKILKELLTNGHDEALAIGFFPDLFPPHRKVLASVKNQNQAYPNYGTIPSKMSFSNFGHPLIEAYINDQSTTAMFDTGAEFSIISNTMAEKLDLKLFQDFPIEVGTVNSLSVNGYFGILDSITVGNVVLKRHPVLVFPEENMSFGVDTLFHKSEFILGWPGVAQIDWKIDGPNKKYQACLPILREVPYHNFFWMGFAALKAVAFNGQSLLFGLDTGADDTELKKDILLKFPDLEVRNTKVGIIGAGGMEKLEIPCAKSFNFYLAGQKITGKELLIRENIDLFFLRQDGTIGAEMFKNHNVRIDYFNRFLSIENK